MVGEWLRIALAVGCIPAILVAAAATDAFSKERAESQGPVQKTTLAWLWVVALAFFLAALYVNTAGATGE